jgi:hypothetical protein
MSDSYITLVPDDPRYVPSDAQISNAATLAGRLMPRASVVSPQINSGIRLFDAGSNFESVHCPGCGKKVSIDWWHETLDADEGEDGFALAQHRMPCCGSSFTLNQLTYDWPQAFGRFGLEIMNPNIGRLSGDVVAQFEKVLGSTLRVIYAHY